LAPPALFFNFFPAFPIVLFMAHAFPPPAPAARVRWGFMTIGDKRGKILQF
jgi:hypothetical protein